MIKTVKKLLSFICQLPFKGLKGLRGDFFLVNTQSESAQMASKSSTTLQYLHANDMNKQ